MESNRQVGWNLENSYATLPEIFYSQASPKQVEHPNLVVLNDQLARSLGLYPQALRTEEGTNLFAGNKLPNESMPLAQAYAGHQFGVFTKLGDGRAILLGEQLTPKGDRFDIQLKGAGRTKYSRGGDGRAGLGPMLREYMISESMHALGIPSSRGLAVVKTGEAVSREKLLPGAILTRVASSHLRVGTFQYALSWGGIEKLRALADYTIHRHLPHIADAPNPYFSLLEEVMKRQASLVAKWQHVGFIHGVMNTDNMTISGETIDYGPCAFMNTYDPNTVFSSIDVAGRYRYRYQPPIAKWNLARFAETLIPLFDKDKSVAIGLAQEIIDQFSTVYSSFWHLGMRRKLGIFNEESEDQALFQDLLEIMEQYEADYTNTFLALTFNELEGMTIFQSKQFKDWHMRWKERLTRQKESAEEVGNIMKNSNPAIIPRNHLVEEALEKAVEESNYNVLKNVLNALANPYAHTKEQADYRKIPVPNTPYQTFCGT